MLSFHAENFVLLLKEQKDSNPFYHKTASRQVPNAPALSV
jgi:hypothetical protein